MDVVVSLLYHCGMPMFTPNYVCGCTCAYDCTYACMCVYIIYHSHIWCFTGVPIVTLLGTEELRNHDGLVAGY